VVEGAKYFGVERMQQKQSRNFWSQKINQPQNLEEVQKKATTWKATLNKRFDGMTFNDAKKLMGWKGKSPKSPDAPIKQVRAEEKFEDLPTNFDTRQQWPFCNYAIRNQEECGSCWAFGATEALADRLCIFSQGKINVTLSPQWLVDCYANEQGCNGGFIDTTWKDLVTLGVPTEQCVPYQGINNACPKTCTDGSKIKLYYAKSAYSIYKYQDVTPLQKEIMTNGPVEVAFYVFSDFMFYHSGVYVQTEGASFVGGHGVKILGWGVDNGIPYWLVANSWSPSWGEMGYFKIRRGTDECAIEDEVATGIPVV